VEGDAGTGGGGPNPYMVRILISACLLGERVRYNGEDKRCGHPLVERWQAEGRVVPFCPEVAGGLGVPRPPAEIVGARVLASDGSDVTAAFARGAELALAEALRQGVHIAILKARSPSCGSGVIYDGTFSGALRAGDGVTSARLRAAGIAVFSEDEMAAAAEAFEGSQE
jgi:uncharacterized protein YbbK (DUF523 family)